MSVSFLHSSVEVNTIPELDANVPIVGKPQYCGQTESHSHLSTDVVIIKGFIEPISIPEKNTAHYIKSINILYDLFIFLILTL